QRDDCTLRRVDDAGAVAPVYYAMRGQKQKLANLRLSTRYVSAEQFAEQSRDLRANAGKRTNGSKKRVKNRWTHGGSINCFVSPCKGEAQSFCALFVPVG